MKHTFQSSQGFKTARDSIFSTPRKNGKKGQLTFKPTTHAYITTPNLFASLDRFSHRIPTKSKSVKFVNRRMELGWNTRFSVTYSKDNQLMPRWKREYFDLPREFEPETKDCFFIRRNNSKGGGSIRRWTQKNTFMKDKRFNQKYSNNQKEKRLVDEVLNVETVR